MPRPALEVAQIFRHHGPDYRKNQRLRPEQHKAMRDIERCRTARLGGHVDSCSQGCGYLAISYNSCRNRHCPKCQSLKQAKWLAERLERLLPTHYFHLVVTLPHELNALARFNPPAGMAGILQAKKADDPLNMKNFWLRDKLLIRADVQFYTPYLRLDGPGHKRGAPERLQGL